MTVLEKFKPIFYPKSVMVVGASKDPNKMGYYCVKSLKDAKFKGKIYPINPYAQKILGFKVYPSIKALPENVDLAVIVIPAKAVPSTLEECTQKQVKGAVIISGGFKEIGREEGLKLQEETVNIANKYGIKIIGPNTFGMVNLHANLNASFTPIFSKLKKGNVALISQSGGMCHIISYHGMEEGIGFSKIVGVGNRCNVEFADLIEYFGEDPETKVIAMYIEGVDDARRMVEAAKKVVGKKPIVAYKVGREGSGKAVYSHTGSLAGKHEIYKAAFKQAGIIIVNSCIELLDTVKALALQEPPNNGRFAVVSKEAGPAITMIDICTDGGLTLAKFTDETNEKLKKLLPPFTIRTNPVDVAFASLNIEAYKEAVRLVLADENVDALLFFCLYHPGIKLPVEDFAKAKNKFKKCMVSCVITPKNMWIQVKRKMEQMGIPVFPSPERAAKTLVNLTFYGKIRKMFS